MMGNQNSTIDDIGIRTEFKCFRNATAALINAYIGYCNAKLKKDKAAREHEANNVRETVKMLSSMLESFKKHHSEIMRLSKNGMIVIQKLKINLGQFGPKKLYEKRTTDEVKTLLHDLENIKKSLDDVIKEDLKTTPQIIAKMFSKLKASLSMNFGVLDLTIRNYSSYNDDDDDDDDEKDSGDDGDDGEEEDSSDDDDDEEDSDDDDDDEEDSGDDDNGDVDVESSEDEDENKKLFDDEDDFLAIKK
jgi:hypothetical protein